MTENEWFTGADFGRCVEFVRDRGSERKKRLYACAYFRAFWDLLVSQDEYFPYEFRELPGNHNWQYWDQQVREFLEVANRQGFGK